MVKKSDGSVGAGNIIYTNYNIAVAYYRKANWCSRISIWIKEHTLDCQCNPLYYNDDRKSLLEEEK